MKRIGRMWTGLSVVAWVGAAMAADREAPLDATVSNSRGEQVRLRDYWGKPTVLFYEDRDSVKLNQPLKDELFSMGKERGMLTSARVVAVANLQGYNWVPARQFALAGVRKAEEEAGIPVLIDWHGTLSVAPWALPSKTSSVLVLDERGQVVLERSGPLDRADRAAVFSTLESLIEGARP